MIILLLVIALLAVTVYSIIKKKPSKGLDGNGKIDSNDQVQNFDN